VASAARRGRPAGELAQPLAVLTQLVLGALDGGRERGPPPVVRHDPQRRPFPRGGVAQRGQRVGQQGLGIERAAMGPPGEHVAG
jgi:hypothetical protein